MESDRYRHILRNLATGVCVVTTHYGDIVNGMTATSISSVSAEPPLIMVCIDKHHKTNKFIKNSGVFTVNFLGEDQQELSEIFAQPNEEKADFLAKISKESRENGCPIIDKSIGYVDCEVVSAYEVADHTLFLGSPLDGTATADKKPLIYFSAGYHTAA